MFNRKGIPQSRLQFLRSLPLFEGIPDKVLARIDQQVTEVSAAPDTVLTRQGDLSSQAFIIAEGQAEVRIDDEVVAHSGPGELVGELGLINHTLRSATVTATTAMSLLVVNPRELNNLLHEEALTDRLLANVRRHQQGAQPAEQPEA
jgi:CRP-like cAMP-binding protein